MIATYSPWSSRNLAKRADAVVDELARVARRQAETDAERRIRRKARLQRRRVPLQRGEDGRPAISGVDVGAVGEVERTVR